jgi:hypothetical protein
VTGDCHAPFWGSPGVTPPGHPTLPPTMNQSPCERLLSTASLWSNSIPRLMRGIEEFIGANRHQPADEEETG